jgi:putative membrane protein
METALAAMSTQQALAERISTQPVPRTYDVFSRYLVHLYTIVFPFAVIDSLPTHQWLIIPATLIVAFAFRIIERIGTAVEFPFANTIQDVPLTTIGTQLVRDLHDLLHDPDKPAPSQPVNGYLW